MRTSPLVIPGPVLTLGLLGNPVPSGNYPIFRAVITQFKAVTKRAVMEDGGNRGSIPGESPGIYLVFYSHNIIIFMMIVIINFCGLGDVAAGKGYRGRVREGTGDT